MRTLVLAICSVFFCGGDSSALPGGAVFTASHSVEGCRVREICSFEVPSSTGWAFHCGEPSFRANLFVDISRTIESKIRAMERYRTMLTSFPHLRCAEALRANGRRWGSVAGVEYAEALGLGRWVRSW